MSKATDFFDGAVYRLNSRPDGPELRDILFAPENREILVALMVEEGVIEPAGCWDAPTITDEMVEAAEDALRRAEAELEASDPDLEDHWADECDELAEAVESLRAQRDHIAVYYEDEQRPEGAVPLYRVNRG